MLAVGVVVCLLVCWGRVVCAVCVNCCFTGCLLVVGALCLIGLL